MGGPARAASEWTSVSGRKAEVVFAATDLSTFSDEALLQAHRRAEEESARLVVCHIVPSVHWVNFRPALGSTPRSGERVEFRGQVRQLLVERTCKVTGRRESDFETVIDEGTPYAGVVEHAEKMGAEMIVVGHRGATGLSRVFLGSVAERVVRYVHAPVLVARPGPSTRRILVASDLSDPSWPALAAAAREARRTGARVTVFHCIEIAPHTAGSYYGSPWSDYGSSWMMPEYLKQAREDAEERLMVALGRCELEADVRIAQGTAPAEITDAARLLQVDLLVVGTRGRTGLRRVLLGSVAESVTRYAPCSVLAVRLAEGSRL
jgi:nucleotide-binding universal stress UspA family protein